MRTDRFLQKRPEVQRLVPIAIVVMDLDFSRKLFSKLFQEGRALRITCEVIELEVAFAGRFKVPHHRKYRCDANAARNEQVIPGTPGQLEVIARCAYRQQVPLPDLVGHAHRATTASFVALDGDLVVHPFGGVTAQRVIAPGAVGHLNGEVGAWRERWQFAAFRITQFKEVNAMRKCLLAGDQKLKKNRAPGELRMTLQQA